ncbi:putative cell wall binding repeat protein [Georgenia soli]|uniref:Putative cell wall binding repeat protein n=1 Tax=Georgenia soli TaxID=638953 RepID=A0A2A9EHZ2_9MICO|nr:putative cell wall binding repeat protein [Georgenia soli]
MLAALLGGILVLGAPAQFAAAAPAPQDDPAGGPVDPGDVAETVPGLPVEPPPSSSLSGGLGTAWNLGLAAESAAITGAAFDDAGAWAVTRSKVPAALYRWDDETGDVVTVRDLPIGAGSWAILALGDDALTGDLLVGTYAPAALVTYSPADGTFGRVVRLGADETVMAMALRADGTVAVGTYNPDGARLLSYDPATGAVTTLARWPESRYVRSLAVVGDAVYAGLGTPAALWRWQGGSTTRIQTPGLESESMVYALTTDGSSVYGGTEPGGQVFTVDAGTGFRLLADTAARTVDALAVDDGDLYYTVRPTGALHRIHVGAPGTPQSPADLGGQGAGTTAEPDGTPVELATPAPGSETRQLFPTADGVLGMSGTADLWRVGDTVEVTALTQHGAPTGPEGSPQGVDLLGTDIVVGGHWRFHQHSPDGAMDKVVPVSGEPKATVAHGGELYAATYPGAEIHRLTKDGTGNELVAKIPGEQMRPRAMIWYGRTGQLLVSTRPAYGRFGGDLTMVDPGTGRLTSYVRPFGDHTVTAMQDWGGDVVVGTETYGEAEGTAPGAGAAYVARWNPNGAVRWKRSVDNAPMVASVTQVRIGVTPYVLASTNLGTVALLDAGTGKILWRTDIGNIVDQLTTVGDRTVGRVDGRLHEFHVTLQGLRTVRLMNDAVRWVALDPDDKNGFVAVAPTADGSPVLWRARLKAAPRPERIGGANRFETAAQMSRARFGSAGTVVLVRYDDFADTLAAAPLASRLDAPILYTTPSALPSQTEAEIKRLGARKVVIVGGTGAVSSGVESALRSRGLGVSRLGGADRYATAAAVATRVASVDGRNGQPVFLVTGLDFPDGLSAAPPATFTGGVVLLTQGTGMPAATRQQISRTRPSAVYTVGGPAQKAATAAGVRPRAAFTGDDRYETAVLVADRWFGSPENAYLANGLTFADALVAAPAAGRERAPIVLTRTDPLDPTTHGYLRRARPGSVQLAGGPGVVSDRVWDQLRRTYY